MKARAQVGAAVAAVNIALLPWALGAGDGTPPGQSCDISLYPLSTPTTRFQDNGDGTVTDKQSRLMWMRCAVGQSWSKGGCAGGAAALTWHAAEVAAQSVNRRGDYFYNDWRLPQVPELAGIAERQCKNPRINLTIFPNTPAEAFWTATSRTPGTTETSAFMLSFGPEGVQYAGKEEQHHVRLVRTAP